MATVSFQDLQVPTPGFGLMSLSSAYGAADDAESLQTLKKALDLGCTFWDTAAIYGKGHNEELAGRFFKENPGAREKVFLASKCGFDFEHKVANSREHILQFIDDSTKRLGSAPDLYYLHRRDPKTPLEVSIGALAEIKAAGKCKYIGLSEPSANTLREACKIAHIDAVQIEYSPWCLVPEENGLMETAKELGVTVVAFSPLGAGFLTGKITKPEDVTDGLRTGSGRFKGEAFEKNLELVRKFTDLAEKKNCTAGQLALAWVAAQGAVPIPGTRRVKNLEENWGATDVTLDDAELKEIRGFITGAAHGDRWPAGVLEQMGQ